MRPYNRLVPLFSATVVLLIATSLALRVTDPTPYPYLLLDAGLGAAAITTAIAIWRLHRAIVQALRSEQVVAAQSLTYWRSLAELGRHGLGDIIDEQFSEWGLSPSEEEIGLLLLKGLGHDEIATMRGTSVRTVRAQARGLYHKAGLTGRSELAAFFLEDLLPPPKTSKPPVHAPATVNGGSSEREPPEGKATSVRDHTGDASFAGLALINTKKNGT